VSSPLAIGGFVIPRRGGARQSRVQDYQRAFSVPRGGCGPATQPAWRAKQFRQSFAVAKNQATASRTTFDAEVRRARRRGPIPEIGWGCLKSLNLT